MSSQPRLDFEAEGLLRPATERVLLAQHEPLQSSSLARVCEGCEVVIPYPRADQRFHDAACRLASWKANRTDAEAEVKRLKALAAEKCREEITIARWAALSVLMRRRECIVSHVRDYLEVRGIELGWARNWPGSMFNHEWFTGTGKRHTAFHKQANFRKVNEYRLSESGHAVCHDILRELGR